MERPLPNRQSIIPHRKGDGNRPRQLQRLRASGYFSGALGCASSSDDTAQIAVEFYSGGPTGTLVDTVSSGEVDPDVGTWNLISIFDNVPQATDTIVMSIVTRLLG